MANKYLRLEHGRFLDPNNSSYLLQHHLSSGCFHGGYAGKDSDTALGHVNSALRTVYEKGPINLQLRLPKGEAILFRAFIESENPNLEFIVE